MPPAPGHFGPQANRLLRVPLENRARSHSRPKTALHLLVLPDLRVMVTMIPTRLFPTACRSCPSLSRAVNRSDRVLERLRDQCRLQAMQPIELFSLGRTEDFRLRTAKLRMPNLRTDCDRPMTPTATRRYDRYPRSGDRCHPLCWQRRTAVQPPRLPRQH